MEVGGYKGEIFFNGIFQMIIGGKKGELFPFVIIKYMHIVYVYIYISVYMYFSSFRTESPATPQV